ncbi:MAG: carotene 7,8-desaturase, partial [Acidobacteriia bacterium]|nr:carotene 7,8-desaturase [Terriglobia bacterium]
VTALIPGLGMEEQLMRFRPSPIVGIHLWFDRPITELGHAMLVDGEVQWIFHKGGGYYLGVVSAARRLVRDAPAEIAERAVAQLRATFPRAREAELRRSRVIKELRATYSAVPGLERSRPGPHTCFPNLFLAGDWTDTGWPATMEGAVRSGYNAAAAVLATL